MPSDSLPQLNARVPSAAMPGSPIRARKIVISAKVRTLLLELDSVMQQFHGHTATLAQSGIESTLAVEVGRLREDVRAQIVGIAWQLNKASTGQDDE